jgi:D-alanine-D-alanine ligase
VGVSKVAAPEELDAALCAAFECDPKAVVETGIDAREIECAVLGNDRPEASVLGEIVPSREFYDYAAKYLDGASELRIPAPVPDDLSARIRALAVDVFEALGLAGLARVDFFVDRGNGEVYVNEANTLPGFTPISMYPKLWEATGLPYPELLSRLLALAVERGASERTRATRYAG